ncbi:MAG: cytochrome P450 [Actinomycetota bacterium]|nr:cytochrome P450 [Actinomycetota bacterium]
MAPIVGRNSVILLDEDIHLAQRRLLLPAFHGERMQRLRGMMAEICEREVACWRTARTSRRDGPEAEHHLQPVALRHGRAARAPLGGRAGRPGARAGVTGRDRG